MPEVTEEIKTRVAKRKRDRKKVARRLSQQAKVDLANEIFKKEQAERQRAELKKPIIVLK
jgi:hypothetical protein